MLDPRSNAVLAALSPGVQRRLFPQFDLVSLNPNSVVYEPGEPIRHCYFPVDCIVSTMCASRDGESVAYAIVGNDGLLGLPLFLGSSAKSRWVIAQRGGHAYRLDAGNIKAEFDRCGEMHHLILCYVQSVLAQAAQFAVCNRHHTVEQQLCRWLLRFADLSRTESVRITHQRIADMLGVRREGITLAARRLQALGAISCRRGDISLLDRPRLERHSCECYSALKHESERLSRHIGLSARIA